MSVKDIMRTEVVTASAEASIKDVAKIMSEKNIGSVLIVDESNRVIGIFTERDLVKVVALGIDINTPIKSVMTTNVISAYPTDNIAAIAIKMLEKGVRRMPVVDEYNRLLGIISIRDVLRAYTAGCEFP